MNEPVTPQGAPSPADAAARAALQERLAPFRGEVIGVLMGGFSSEREVSLRSGKNVLDELLALGLNAVAVDVDERLLESLREKGVTLAVNLLHGTFGEDGHLQAILEFLKIPYTGEDLLASALCMNKVRTKELFDAHHIKTSPHFAFGPWLAQGGEPSRVSEQLDLLGFHAPLVIKPVAEGSSVGVKVLRDKTSLKQELERLAGEGKLSSYFLEKYLTGREITVGLFRDRGEVRILPILELKPKNAFYDFEAKYTKGMTEMILPAPLAKGLQARVERMARVIFAAFGLRNCVRVDMILENGIPYVLEVNTQPGMTATSDIPAMLQAAAIPMAEFLAANLENARR
jgi:D-alanine-D-alanine ligase